MKVCDIFKLKLGHPGHDKCPDCGSLMKKWPLPDKMDLEIVWFGCKNHKPILLDIIYDRNSGSVKEFIFASQPDNINFQNGAKDFTIENSNNPKLDPSREVPKTVVNISPNDLKVEVKDIGKKIPTWLVFT